MVAGRVTRLRLGALRELEDLDGEGMLAADRAVLGVGAGAALARAVDLVGVAAVRGGNQPAAVGEALDGLDDVSGALQAAEVDRGVGEQRAEDGNEVDGGAVCYDSGGRGVRARARLLIRGYRRRRLHPSAPSLHA